MHHDVVTLTHRYLINAVRGHKTGSNTLEWKTGSGGTLPPSKHVRIYVFFPRPIYFLHPYFLYLLYSRNIEYKQCYDHKRNTRCRANDPDYHAGFTLVEY